MKEILARIRSFYIKKKKLAVGLTAAVAVLALATGVYAVLPMVNAANESGSQFKVAGIPIEYIFLHNVVSKMASFL